MAKFITYPPPTTTIHHLIHRPHKTDNIFLREVLYTDIMGNGNTKGLNTMTDGT